MIILQKGLNWTNFNKMTRCRRWEVGKSRNLQDKKGGFMYPALLHLHFNGIVHRDLKPGNILVHYKDDHQVGMAKCADFGYSQRSYITRTKRTLNSKAITRQRTMTIILPEVLIVHKKCPACPSWDVWPYALLTCHVMAPPKRMPVDVWHAGEWSSTGKVGSAA